MARLNWKQVLAQSYTFLWAALLITLPFTSLPLFGRLTGAIVAPLAAIPLVLLILVWLLPYLLRRGSLPGETIPLTVFFLVSLAISAAAFFFDVTYIKDKTLLSQTVRSLIPVAIGAAFYFAFAAWPKDEPTLKKMLQFIHIGGAVFVAWALMQAVFILFYQSKYPHLVEMVRDALVIQQYGVTNSNRIAGFAYEPSWFAHQLNVLYFPLWLAASYLRKSAFRWRFLKLSFENILLGLGLVAFFLSSPRIGTLALLTMLAFLMIKVILVVYRRSVQYLRKHWINKSAYTGWIRFLSGMGMVVVFISLCFTFVYLYLNLGGKRDWRLTLVTNYHFSSEDIQTLNRLDENSLLLIGQRFAFLERVSFWVTGWHIFNDYPIIGVGLGNAGFNYFDRLPAVSWGTYEIRELVYRATALPNIKSFWVRLLAETGIIGFILFVSWYVLLWRSARTSQHSRSPEIMLISLSGQLALVAFLVEGFSIDSFALPYLWVITGLISAVGAVHRKGALEARLKGRS